MGVLNLASELYANITLEGAWQFPSLNATQRIELIRRYSIPYSALIVHRPSTHPHTVILNLGEIQRVYRMNKQYALKLTVKQFHNSGG
jgi:hypothetical protein